MEIAPNTVIKFYTNMPLDNTYEHTLYFNSISSQISYFHNPQLPRFVFNNNTYQRISNGVMRIKKNSLSLLDCSYMAFQNTEFGNKWFYAFVTNVDYVNNETAEVHFELDVLQTFLFDVQLKDSFVEREHAMTDKAGDNVVAEPIEIGDITTNDIQGTSFFDSYVAVICSASTADGSTAGGYIGGLFTGCSYLAGRVDNQEQVNLLLEYLKARVDANEQDSVVSIFLMPTAFYTDEAMPSVQAAKVMKNNKIHGYTPKNKKLLTYPYNYLAVDCGNNDAIYRYEWFIDNPENTCNFVMTGCMSCNPQIMLEPQGYNGVSSGKFNWAERLVMEGFPQVAWSIDSFRAWIAQESSGAALSLLGSGVGLGASISAANPVGIASSAIGLASSINSVVQAANRPPQARGSSTGTVDVATRSKNFYFKQMQVSYEYARIIDDFFNMYGYQTNRVKIPNRSGRRHWNYVKTRNCVVVGNAPAPYIKKICSIYDNGITFWKNANNVGNYSLDNSI